MSFRCAIALLFVAVEFHRAEIEATESCPSEHGMSGMSGMSMGRNVRASAPKVSESVAAQTTSTYVAVGVAAVVVAVAAVVVVAGTYPHRVQ
jgi:hypothetical protein